MPTSPIVDSCESIPALSTAQTKDGIDIPMDSLCQLNRQNSDFGDLDSTSMTKKVKSRLKCTKCVNFIILYIGLVAIISYLIFDAVTGKKCHICQQSENNVVATGSPTVYQRAPVHYMLRMNLAGKDREGVLMWSCPQGGNSSFVCKGRTVTIPVSGWYILHLKLGVNTNLATKRLNTKLRIHDCISKQNLKGFVDMEHCIRMKQAPDWEGPSEIIALRQYLKEGEIIKATTSTDESMIELRHSMMEIALVERDYT